MSGPSENISTEVLNDPEALGKGMTHFLAHVWGVSNK
jgi:hypothetical protein